MSGDLERLRGMLDGFGKPGDRELISRALQRLLGPEAIRVDELISSLLGAPSRSPIYDAMIEMTLADVDDANGKESSEFFEVTRTWTGSIELDDYMVALVSSAEAQKYVTYNCPGIFDTWYIPDPDLIDHNAQLMTEQCSISYLPRRGPETMVGLERKEGRRAELLGEDAAQRFARDVKLFGAHIGQRDNKNLTVTNVQRFPLDEPYIYWTTASPMFLRRVNFDLQRSFVNYSPRFLSVRSLDSKPLPLVMRTRASTR